MRLDSTPRLDILFVNYLETEVEAEARGGGFGYDFCQSSESSRSVSSSFNPSVQPFDSGRLLPCPSLRVNRGHTLTVIYLSPTTKSSFLSPLFMVGTGIPRILDFVLDWGTFVSGFILTRDVY